MKLIPQITIFLENIPGSMSKVCGLIKDLECNIEAFTVFGTVDHGVLRIIVDDPEKVLNGLSGKGYLAIQSEVIEVPAENSPGVLYEITLALSGSKINVEYGYGSTKGQVGRERFYIQASDNQKALKLLKEKL